MASRTVTRTGTVTITRRESRLRQLLAVIAAANDRGEYPSKADLIPAGTPSRTRADMYRAVDKLIDRHLADPGQDGGRYRLTATDAGRDVLSAGSAEVSWEETEYGTIGVLLTEHICDSAAFSDRCKDRAQADELFAGRYPRLHGSHVVAVTVTERWEQPGRPAETLTTDVLWQVERCTGDHAQR